MKSWYSTKSIKELVRGVLPDPQITQRQMESPLAQRTTVYLCRVGCFELGSGRKWTFGARAMCPPFVGHAPTAPRTFRPASAASTSAPLPRRGAAPARRRPPRRRAAIFATRAAAAGADSDRREGRRRGCGSSPAKGARFPCVPLTQDARASSRLWDKSLRGKSRGTEVPSARRRDEAWLSTNGFGRPRACQLALHSPPLPAS